MRMSEKYVAVRFDTPSSLVGEGITDSRYNNDWVRGSIGDHAMPRQPLTRLRFAVADAKHRRPILERRPEAAYASPTRGEGKSPAIQRRQAT